MSSTKVPRITYRTIEKLARVAEEVEEKIANGEAVEKVFSRVANKYGLTDSQIHLLVQGWNIARMQNKFASCKTLDERLEELQAIYYDELLKKLDRKAEEPVKQAVHYKYLVPPKDETKRAVLGVDKFNLLHKKNGELVLKERKAFLEKQARQIKTERLRNDLNHLVDEIKNLEAQLVVKKAALKKAIEVSAEDKQVMIQNLNAIDPLAANLVENTDVKQHLNDKKYIPFSENRSPYKEALECAKIARLLDETVAFMRSLKPDIDDFKPITEAPKISKDLLEELMVGEKKITKKAEDSQRKAENMDNSQGKSEKPDNIKRAQRRGGGGSDIDKKIKDLMAIEKEFIQEPKEEEVKLKEIPERFAEKLRDFAQEVKLRAQPEAIRTHSFIANMMLQDPILSNYDPRDVYQAYRELYSIAPYAMLNYATAKALLRKILAQGGVLDIYDIKTVSDINRRYLQDRKTSQDSGRK